MLEKDIEKYLVKECKKRGFLTMKAGQNGWPDRVIITNDGRHFWIELKSETGRPSALQIRYVNALKLQGADARFVYGLDGVKAFFKEVDDGRA